MSNRNGSSFKGSVPRSKRDSYLQDGVDHINIGMEANTTLGKLLSMDAEVGFNHPIFGKFKTLMGFWYYISCGQNKDDRFRYMTGKKLYALFKRKKKGPLHIRNFKAIILEAAYLKIIQNHEVFQEVFDNILEMDCYRTLDSGLREEFSYSRWWVAGLRSISYCVQTGTHPDFSYFMDRGSQDIYIDVLPNYLRHALSEKERQEEVAILEKHLAGEKENHVSENEEVTEGESWESEIEAPTEVYVPPCEVPLEEQNSIKENS